MFFNNSSIIGENYSHWMLFLWWVLAEIFQSKYVGLPPPQYHFYLNSWFVLVFPPCEPVTLGSMFPNRPPSFPSLPPACPSLPENPLISSGVDTNSQHPCIFFRSQINRLCSIVFLIFSFIKWQPNYVRGSSSSSPSMEYLAFSLEWQCYRPAEG